MHKREELKAVFGNFFLSYCSKHPKCSQYEKVLSCLGKIYKRPCHAAISMFYPCKLLLKLRQAVKTTKYCCMKWNKIYQDTVLVWFGSVEPIFRSLFSQELCFSRRIVHKDLHVFVLDIYWHHFPFIRMYI